MGEILSNLNIQWQVILVNLIGFVALWFTAQKLVFVPVGSVIAEREEDVNKAYAELDANQKQMQSLKEDYERRLATVEAEGRERINNMVKEAQAIRDQVVNDANIRAKEMVTRAEQEIAREQEIAFQNIRRQVVDLALGAATKVIGDGLDESRQRRLIDDFIAGGGTFDTALASVSAPALTPAPSGVAGVAAAVRDAAGSVADAVVDAVTDAGTAIKAAVAGGEGDDSSAPAKATRARRTTKAAGDTSDAAADTAEKTE